MLDQQSTSAGDTSKHKTHSYTIYTTPAKRFRRWSNIVWMSYKCFVFTGMSQRQILTWVPVMYSPEPYVRGFPRRLNVNPDTDYRVQQGFFNSDPMIPNRLKKTLYFFSRQEHVCICCFLSVSSNRLSRWFLIFVLFCFHNEMCISHLCGLRNRDYF